MNLNIVKTEDILLEKHVPVIEKTNLWFNMKVWEIEHSMSDEHYIEWIEITFSNWLIQKKFLNLNDKPEIILKTVYDIVKVRIYCNLHGLWEKNIK